jgi:hypothetical protein
MDNLTEEQLLSQAMRLLGSRRSARKAKTSAANGRLGGRPRSAKRKRLDRLSAHGRSEADVIERVRATRAGLLADHTTCNLTGPHDPGGSSCVANALNWHETATKDVLRVIDCLDESLIPQLYEPSHEYQDVDLNVNLRIAGQLARLDKKSQVLAFNILKNCKVQMQPWDIKNLVTKIIREAIEQARPEQIRSVQAVLDEAGLTQNLGSSAAENVVDAVNAVDLEELQEFE